MVEILFYARETFKCYPNRRVLYSLLLIVRCSFREWLFSFGKAYHFISHVGSGIVPVDGVGRITYGHCLYHVSPFRSITCILFPQSIFLHLILYLLFPRLFRSSSSSTTTHFKFQSVGMQTSSTFALWAAAHVDK